MSTHLFFPLLCQEAELRIGNWYGGNELLSHFLNRRRFRRELRPLRQRRHRLPAALLIVELFDRAFLLNNRQVSALPALWFDPYPPRIRLLARPLCPSRFVPTVASTYTVL